MSSVHYYIKNDDNKRRVEDIVNRLLFIYLFIIFLFYNLLYFKDHLKYNEHWIASLLLFLIFFFIIILLIIFDENNT